MRYIDVAAQLLATGCGDALPLGEREKASPPTGYTGEQGARVTDADIERWADTFPRWNKETKRNDQIPSINVALRLAPTVVGIDVDNYGSKTGHVNLLELERELGALPTSWASTSRDDGVSGIWFYRIPAGHKFPGKPCADVEFIQHGHRYAVVAPSIHPEGRPYQWFEPNGDPSERPPRVDELAELPAAWLEADFEAVALRIAEANVTVQTTPARTPTLTIDGERDLLRPRDSNRPSKAVDSALGTYYRTAGGGRHDAMVKAVMTITRLEHQDHPGASQALDSLRADFIHAVTTDTGKMLRTQAEAEREFDDARTTAKSKLAAEPDKRPNYRDLISGANRPGSSSTADGTTGDTTPPSDLPASWSDAHVGEAFGRTLNGRWLYCRPLGGWHRWDGRRWLLDHGEAVHEEFRQWIIGLGERLWQQSVDGDTMRQVAKYRDSGKINAAVTIARRLEFIAATPDEFDRHPHLLNALNGVIDLRTGTLFSHDPTLRLTKLAGAEYHPDAQHPDFDAVLAALNDDVAGWVQQLFGGAAYGSVVDDVLAVFDGTGSNGKTTILKAVSTALGEYAAPASTRLLLARGVSDEHPTLIADLFGRRLVYIEETPEGGALRMEQVKSITGGSTLKARFIGKDYFDFEPTHQIIVATNHRPAVNASDYAAWRRLRLVPFTRTYVLPHEAQPGDLVADRGLRARLSKPAQRTAALAWVVAGAVAWHEAGGLGACDSVDQATSEWRRSEDVIHAWWADRIELGGEARASDVYSSFVDWCSQEGRRYISSNKEFAKKFTDHDLYRNHAIRKRNTSNGAWYSGLSVVDVVGGGVGFQLSSREGPGVPPTTTTTSRANAWSEPAEQRLNSGGSL
jgi:putative DNA primase/helicase